MAALTVLLATLLPFVAHSISTPDAFAPLILWSNSGVVGAGKGAQVLYEVLDTQLLVNSVVSGASDDRDAVASKLMKPITDHLDAVIIYAGSQMDAAALRKAGSSAKLQSLLEDAASSLVIPFSTLGGSSLQKSLAASLTSLNIDSKSIQVQTVGCNGPADDQNLGQEVAKSLQDSGELQVVLVCPSASASSSLDAELQKLDSIQEAMDASDLQYVIVYTSQSTTISGKGRSLLQAAVNESSTAVKGGLTGFGPYTACGVLCQTQVRWLEGMLALLILALASCAGLSCLLVLNTPTRFEAMKEAAA